MKMISPLKRLLVKIPRTSIRHLADDCGFTAKVLKYEKYGEPCDVVKITEEEIAPPKGKEVVVKMILAPINPADINTIQGTNSIFHIKNRLKTNLSVILNFIAVLKGSFKIILDK